MEQAARLLALAGAIAAFGAFSPDALAAGEARLDVFPERPRVGEPTTIQLRTYWTFADRTPPAIFPAGYPMIHNLLGPNGRQATLRLARDPRDPHRWRGTFRFPSSGRWIVCGANFQPSLEGCIEANLTRRLVLVRRRGARADVWHRLQRPLTTPSIADGDPCPTAAATGDLGPFGFVGTTWGNGPAYPILGQDEPLLQYADPIPASSAFVGSGWFGAKVMWVLDRRAYRGPVLIRGRQVDGPNVLRFGSRRQPARELRIGAAVQSNPSFTRVRGPGCYAYQVDGLGFSHTIVLAATPLTSP